MNAVVMERQVIIGLIVSNDYAKRIKPIWRDDLLASSEMQLITRWLLRYHEEYGQAPGRDIEQIYLSAFKNGEMSKAEALLIEDILTGVSHDWIQGYSDQFNATFLADETVKFFQNLALESGIEEASARLARGQFGEAVVAMTEGAAVAATLGPIGDLARARVAAWKIASAGAPAERLPDPWGDPEPPPFDLDVLPPVLRYFAKMKASAIGVESGSMAWSAIGVCSAALNGSLRLQMKRSDPDFAVPPGIWLLQVGDPSSKKSPTLKAAFSPLFKIQAERSNRYREERAEWDSMDASARGTAPVLEQIWTADATTEGLRDALSAQDRGIVSFNDELSSLIGSMGRYAGGKDPGAADRAFFNSAFDGVPWASNRANRRGGERIVVPNLQITVIGGCQPEVLRGFNRGNALTIDGMLQRMCPILMGKTRIGSDVDTIGIGRRYENLIRRLVAVPGNRVLCLTEAAEAIRRRVEKRLYHLEQSDALGDGFKTAIGKIHGIWGRLALTLAHVIAPRDAVSEVDDRAAALAERLVFDNLIPNMARFYQMLGGGGDVEKTRAIAAFLLRQRRVRVTSRDIIQHVSSLHRSKVDQVREDVSPLVNMGWLTPEGDDERRARAWEVNSAIYSQFAERAAQAQMSAALAREAIAGSFADRRAERAGEPNPTTGLDRQPSPGEPGEALNVYDVYCAGESNSSATPFLEGNEEGAPTARRARNNIINIRSVQVGRR
jgi:hypothetical protein